MGSGNERLAHHHNWNDAASVMNTVEVEVGTILQVIDVQGMHMKVAPAEPDTAVGRLLVAKHASPGMDTVSAPDALGIALPWMLFFGLDTRKARKFDAVFLGPEGRPTLRRSGNARMVGHVVVVGPATTVENGEPDCGAVLLDPNLPG